MILLELFWRFLKIGTLGFGGGQAMIPLIESETVQQGKLLSLSDFYETVALSNALPGPIATKLAVAIGFESAGVLGSIASLLGVVLPSSLGILMVLSVLNRFSDHPLVSGIQLAARPLVIALILGVALTMGITLIQSMEGFQLQRNFILTIIFVGSLTLYLVSSYTKLNIPVALIVLGMLFIGSLRLSA